MELILKEWFWSKKSALSAASRAEKEGYVACVKFALRADGRRDWLLEVFSK